MEFQFTEGRIYNIDERQELMAQVTYVVRAGNEVENEVDIDHTYVNPALRGQGIGNVIMEATARYFREKGLKTTASCSYANNWLQKNREAYRDIISDAF